MSDIKQKAREKFEDYSGEYSSNIDAPNSMIKSFIDQVIDLAISDYQTNFEQKHIASALEVERNRIQTDMMKQLNGFFDWAEQIKAKEIGHWEIMYGMRPEEFKQMIISIINQ